MGDVIRDHLVKAVPARIPQCKLTIFLFVTTKYFRVNYFEQISCFSLNFFLGFYFIRLS